MYPLISVFIIVVGALLLVFANKIIKNNKVNRIGIKVVGGILIIVGLLLLYFLLSGKLTLPLSKVSEIRVCGAKRNNKRAVLPVGGPIGEHCSFFVGKFSWQERYSVP